MRLVVGVAIVVHGVTTLRAGLPTPAVLHVPQGSVQDYFCSRVYGGAAAKVGHTPVDAGIEDSVPKDR